MVADRDDDVVVVKETKETKKHAKNGPKNSPNPKILPHLGSPMHRLDATTIVDVEATAIDAANVETTAIDATAIDAANVEVTAIDATAIDAANVEVTAIDATAIDAANVEVTAIDATAIDAANVDATAIDATAIDAANVGRWIMTTPAHPFASGLPKFSTADYYAPPWSHLEEFCVFGSGCERRTIILSL
jgi:hypothetical protein